VFHSGFVSVVMLFSPEAGGATVASVPSITTGGVVACSTSFGGTGCEGEGEREEDCGRGEEEEEEASKIVDPEGEGATAVLPLLRSSVALMDLEASSKVLPEVSISGVSQYQFQTDPTTGILPINDCW
jgi:hypothetical protein